jgi:isopentenyl diphosphate isomerase/L-lactate dehydrogenase-like FMN-dependent dehydrogenase
VAVAARVELDRAVGARVTPLQVTAQGGRTTGADVAQSLALFGSDAVSPPLEQRLFVFANDSG